MWNASVRLSSACKDRCVSVIVHEVFGGRGIMAYSDVFFIQEVNDADVVFESYDV